MKLLIKKVYPDALIPSYGSSDAAGLDLCAFGNHIVPPKERKLIGTGICIEWRPSYLDEEIEKPSDYYFRIAPRSGLSVKHCIDIGAGIVDSDYRGEIKICFINNSNTEAFNIHHGDIIAQGILERIKRFDSISVIDNELGETNRGTNGFGSTGIH
jgi:dUTP pyrophosphatase